MIASAVSVRFQPSTSESTTAGAETTAPHDIPREIIGSGWRAKYSGQTQKWYALRFTGNDREIDIARPAGGHKPEFMAWRWEPMRNLPDLVVPFKRAVYERVVKEFAKLATPA